MTNKELIARWNGFGVHDFDKQLFQEYITFCNYAPQEDFDNYFRVKEISESDFLSLVDFFYTNYCYNMLFRLFRDNRERLIMLDIESVKEIKIRDDLEQRMERLSM